MTRKQIETAFRSGKAKEYEALFVVPITQVGAKEPDWKQFIFSSKAEDFCKKHKISPEEIVAYKRIDYIDD